MELTIEDEEMLARELYEYLETIDPSLDDGSWEACPDTSKPFWIAAAKHVVLTALRRGIVIEPTITP